MAQNSLAANRKRSVMPFIILGVVIVLLLALVIGFVTGLIPGLKSSKSDRDDFFVSDMYEEEAEMEMAHAPKPPAAEELPAEAPAAEAPAAEAPAAEEPDAEAPAAEAPPAEEPAAEAPAVEVPAAEEPGDRLYAGGDKIVWLHEDGTVTGAGFVDGHLQEMRAWYDITDVAVASSHAMGLRSDGTIVQVGGSAKLDTSNLRNVVYIAAGKNHTVAVHENGSCTLLGYSSNLVMSCFENLKNITQVSIGSAHSAAVNKDADWFVAGSAAYGKEDLSWNLPVSKLVCGGDHTIALNNNGAVVATGANNYGQCETQSWRDIVDVAAGALHTVGLRSDGTVVATGHNQYGQCNVNGWTDIVAIACGDYFTVGVRANGQILVAQSNGPAKAAQKIAETWVLPNPQRTEGLDF